MAKTIASFAVFTDAKDAMPGLNMVSVEFGLTDITVLATDRYVAARGCYAYDGLDDAFTVYLNPAAIKFITAIKAKTGLVQFTAEDGKLTITDFTSSYSEWIFTGKFPPIESLILNHKAGPIGEFTLKIDLVAKLAKVVNASGKKAEVWQFTTGEQIGNRPGPLLAKQAGVSVLIQPNLAKDL
jgi:hypothetical protein